MNLPNRQRTLGLLAGAALAVLLGDRLVLSPLIASWKSRTAHIADLQKRVAQGSVLVDRETTIRRRWAEIQTNALPRETSIAQSQLLNAIFTWSKESGVGVTSIRPQWKREADDSMALECRTDAFGSLADLARFLYLAEKDSLGVKIDNVELTPKDPQGEQLNLVVQFNGLVLPPPRKS